VFDAIIWLYAVVALWSVKVQEREQDVKLTDKAAFDGGWSESIQSKLHICELFIHHRYNVFDSVATTLDRTVRLLHNSDVAAAVADGVSQQ